MRVYLHGLSARQEPPPVAAGLGSTLSTYRVPGLPGACGTSTGPAASPSPPSGTLGFCLLEPRFLLLRCSRLSV